MDNIRCQNSLTTYLGVVNNNFPVLNYI